MLHFGLKHIIKLFRTESCCVTGKKGTGKDLITGNVIVRRKRPYISNMNYGGKYISLDYNKLNIGNTYDNLISGNIVPFDYSYPEKADIYISDVGIYFPSQYCNELNKKYPYISTYMALSRHLGDNAVHINVQNLNRCYDKIREMSDTYITCQKTIYLFGLCITSCIIYDKYDSCVSRCKPCRIKVPIFNKQAKMQARIYRDNFFNQHGKVEKHTYIYFNRSKYDTRRFKAILCGN